MNTMTTERICTLLCDMIRCDTINPMGCPHKLTRTVAHSSSTLPPLLRPSALITLSPAGSQINSIGVPHPPFHSVLSLHRWDTLNYGFNHAP